MKVLKWLDQHFEQTLLSILLIAMTVILTIQIIMRYIFHNSLTWAEELSCIMLVWSGFLSVSYTIRQNSAMRLTMAATALPMVARNAILLAAQIIMLVFFGFLSVQSFALLSSTQQSTPALGMPMVYLYVITTIGFTLGVIRCAQAIFRIVKNFTTGDELNWLPPEVREAKEGDEEKC